MEGMVRSVPPPRGARVCRESRPDLGDLCPPAEVRRPALRYLRCMPAQLRQVVAALRRHPVAADTALAVFLAGAALVSMYGTFELLRQDRAFDEPDKTWIVVAILATTLPLALRRRFPLSAASAVIAAFIASRVWTSPDIPGLQAWEAYITVWATWLALYSAAVHGRPRSRALVVIAVL